MALNCNYKVHYQTMGILILLFMNSCTLSKENTWEIKTEKEWIESKKMAINIQFNPSANSTSFESQYSSKLIKLNGKQQLNKLTLKQGPAWNNWTKIPKIGPKEMDNAPVFISPKEGEYYLLARFWPLDHGNKKWDENGRITNDPRELSEKGYHAWFSSDMKTWEHCGPVSGYRERWVTTAEYKDGQFYIYYDNPNDEDPHLIIDDNLKDGIMGKDYGMVFNDPSHGSDCAVLRDEDETWHFIYENWDPINAKTHAWDSPLAGHAVSGNGIDNWSIKQAIVDERTIPTGTFAEYVHGTTKQSYRFQIHTPKQNVFGDWTSIKVGKQYYLFSDYDPAHTSIKIGCFTGTDLNQQFEFIGEFGKGHPDPTIGFAKGNFYLITKNGNYDYISSGPWLNGIEVRIGIDTNGDDQINYWTEWQKTKESYSRKDGFARIIDVTPASIELKHTPKAYGFCFEYRTVGLNNQSTLVQMQSVQVSYN